MKIFIADLRVSWTTLFSKNLNPVDFGRVFSKLDVFFETAGLRLVGGRPVSKKDVQNQQGSNFLKRVWSNLRKRRYFYSVGKKAGISEVLIGCGSWKSWGSPAFSNVLIGS